MYDAPGHAATPRRRLAAMCPHVSCPYPYPRHGDADHHEEKPVLVSHLHSALQCAQSLARNGSLEVSVRRPLLLISDFNVGRPSPRVECGTLGWHALLRKRRGRP